MPHPDSPSIPPNDTIRALDTHFGDMHPIARDRELMVRSTLGIPIADQLPIDQLSGMETAFVRQRYAGALATQGAQEMLIRMPQRVTKVGLYRLAEDVLATTLGNELYQRWSAYRQEWIIRGRTPPRVGIWEQDGLRIPHYGRQSFESMVPRIDLQPAATDTSHPDLPRPSPTGWAAEVGHEIYYAIDIQLTREKDWLALPQAHLPARIPTKLLSFTNVEPTHFTELL